MTSYVNLRSATLQFGLTAAIAFLCAVSSAQADQTSDLSDRFERLWAPTDNKWVSYGQGDTQAGNLSVSSGGQLMTPLWQDESSLLFGDFRGRANDHGGIEGNVGIGYRKLNSYGWIVGGYGFYDVRQSNYGNTFQQATLGIEAMSLEWDARFNGYIPDGKAYNISSGVGVGPATPVLNGNQLALSYSGAMIERSYYGFDGEVGYLLASSASGNAELRGFVGGYNFATTDPRFPEIVGPRARLEARLYDLGWLLGNGSRLVAGFEYQYDRVRESQYIGLVQVRIPLGRSTRTLTRLERRMLDTVVRDVDVVTQADLVNTNQKSYETAQIQSPIDGHWQQVGSVTQANSSSNLSQVVQNAGSNSTVFVDGSGGPVTVSSPIVMNDNQRLFGGGETVELRSATTHQEYTYIVPGTQPTLVAANSSTNVIVVGNNDWVGGFTIHGGNSAISSGTMSPSPNGFTPVTGLAIQDANISGANIGVAVGDLTNSLIEHVQSSNNTSFGFVLDGLTNSTVRSNTANNEIVGFSTSGVISQDSTFAANSASQNSQQGYVFFGNFNGQFVGNVAQNNSDVGIQWWAPVTGTVSNNTASGNGSDGFQLQQGLSSSGQFTGNLSQQNAASGYYVSTIDGTFSGNIANGNVDGFYMNNLTGTFSNNTASQNTVTGIYVGTISSTGVFDSNQSVGNLGDGILGVTMAGSVTNNISTQNGISGIGFVGTISGQISGNQATDNQTRGFYFDTLTSTAVVQNNVADHNSTGFEIVSGSAGLMTGNSATNNSGDGILWVTPVNGTVSNNNSSGNGALGFNVYQGISSSGVFTGNIAANNGGNGFYVSILDGTFSANKADGNAQEGIYLYDISSIGVANGNVATHSGMNGIYGFLMDGQFNDNVAHDNSWSGIGFIGSISGTVSNNLSQDNLGHGFYLNSMTSTAVIQDNVAINNATGFTGVAFNGYFQNAGSITGNIAKDNVGTGFYFSEALTGTMSGNAATNNGSDGFTLTSGIGSTGQFNGNTSTNNAGQGYLINSNSGSAASNTGSGNTNGVNEYP